MLITRRGFGAWLAGAIIAQRFRFTYNPGDSSQELPAFSSGVRCWTGAADSDWGNAANWSGGGVPTCSDVAVFAGGESVSSGTARDVTALVITRDFKSTIGSAA